jgi:PX domain-containing protein kinase-like protein
VAIQNLESGTYAIKNIHPNGSVKDHIYATQYKSTYANKYSNPKQSKPFTIGQIAYYGYQILIALKFLHEKGLPYGHLHTGNIAIINQRIVLMDVENSILGVPSKLRHFLLRHKKICTMESVDVYSFGHALYEMTYGCELLESTCESFQNNGSTELSRSFK